MTIPLRILIVEDSADDTEVTLLELSRGGLAPDWKRVETGDEMRAALAEGSWDAVLSDFSLPGFSAAEALALCRKTDPDLPFIVVSGTIGEQRAVEMMRAGAGDYLLKGNLARLSAAVEREVREAGSRRARRRAETAALIQAALVLSSTDAIIAKTVDGVITNWNPAAALLFGWTPEEVVGRHISFIVPADYADEHAAIKDRLANGERVAALETVRLRKDGTQVEVSLSVSPLQEPDGRLIGWSWIVRDITENKRAETALRESEAFNRSLMDASADCIKVLDANGRLLHMNGPGLCAMEIDDFGPLCGQAWAGLWPGDAGADIERAITTSNGGTAHTFQAFCPTAKGTPRWWDVTVSPVRDTPDGQVVRLLAVSRDITERVRSEERLRASEERYRTLVAATAAIVWTSPASGEFDSDQPGWTAFTGQTVEQHRGWGWLDAVHPDDREDSAAAWSAAMAEKNRYEVEHRLRRADGEYRSMSARAVPVLDSGGAIREWVGVHTDVTEQRRADEAVRESEERYHRLADAMPQIVWATKPDGYHEFYNRQWYNYTGLTFGETEGERWNHVFHPDDQPLAWERWRHALATGDPYEIEYRCRRHDGEYRWFLGRALPQRDEAGRIVRWFGTCTDIHDFKLALVERVALLARLNLQVERMPLAYLLSGPDMRYTRWNPAAERTFGFTQAEVLGKHPFEVIVPPESQSPVADIFARLAAGEMDAHGECENVTRDGRTIICAWYNTPLFNTDGTFEGVLSLAQDVTERKRAEATLRDREELLGNVIAHIPAGVFWKDRDGRFLGANDRFALDQGFSSPEAVIGKMDPDLPVARAEAEAFREADLRIMALGEPVLNVEESQTRSDGRKVYLLVSKVPLRDTTGQVSGVLGVYQDVTEARLLEEQFRQAQKMDAFGQLAGGVAHDFNNLLTIINGYSELLLGTLPESDPSREMIAEIHKAGERSARLTSQLLAFSRRQILATRILNLNESVADTDKMLRRVIGEDIRLTTTLETHPWSVQADPGQIEQVLLNLAVNARDAMPKGGRLTIETKNVELDESYVRTRKDARAGRHVVLSVADTGSGMPPAVMAKIFEPFFTTKEPGKGTGLGLATVYGIVKQSGGHVAVYSEVGVGTTFKVYLPQAEQASERSKAPPRTVAPPRGTETILLAEDEVGVRTLTRTILTECGYRVLEAADGDEAVRVAAGHGGPIHLLITDVVMPGAGGRAVAEQLTDQYPRMRVIFISGYTDDAVIRHGVLREGVNFIQKPFTPAALARKVRDVLDGTA